jgi:uncharacterized protein YxeA
MKKILAAVFAMMFAISTGVFAASHVKADKAEAKGAKAEAKKDDMKKDDKGAKAEAKKDEKGAKK